MKKNNRYTDFDSENATPDTSELEQLIDGFLTELSHKPSQTSSSQNSGLGLRRLEQMRENQLLYQEITDIFGADADNDPDMKKAS